MIKRVVPWINDLEWQRTYKKCFSSDISKIKKGLSQINVWKSRSSSDLPVAIEVTYLLLQAELMSLQHKTNETQTRMLYSMAIVQFVNLALEKYQTKMTLIPLRILAFELKIPGWIIDLRHEATHKSLPPLYILKKGAEFALGYLKSNYWEKQSKFQAERYISLLNKKNKNDTSSIKEVVLDDTTSLKQTKEKSSKIDLNPEMLVRKCFDTSRKYFYNRNLQGAYLKPIMRMIKALMFSNSIATFELILKQMLTKLSTNNDLNSNVLHEDLKVWWPMITLLNEFGKLNDLFLELIKFQSDKHPQINYAICDLIVSIINIAMSDNFDGKLFAFKQPCQLDGRELIKTAMLHPNPFTKHLITSFFNCCVDPLSEISKTQLLGLIDCVNNAPSTIESKSLQTSLLAPPSNKEVAVEKWTLITDKIKWTHWPLGKCTYQTTNCLQLPTMPNQILVDDDNDNYRDDDDVCIDDDDSPDDNDDDDDDESYYIQKDIFKHSIADLEERNEDDDDNEGLFETDEMDTI